MKNVTLLICVCFPLSILAQPTLEKSYNQFRDGDNLIKQQVGYKSPGQAGSNRFWDFGQQKSIDEHYELSYFGVDSLMIGREHRTLYKYTLRNDSLFSLGYENPTTLVNYTKPELLLVFPVHYQDKGKAAYSGSGEYCGRMKFSSGGETAYEADAYGMITLPSGDTLNNVLRIHLTRKISGQFSPDPEDSLDMQVDTYRWYADGYRYPVFETVDSKFMKDGTLRKHFNTAFYYTPEEQYYELENDDDNQDKRERIKLESFKKQALNPEKQFNTEIKNKSIDYQVVLDKEANSLTLDYQLLKDEAEEEIILFDVQGRILKKYPKEKHHSGSYQKVIPLNAGNPLGEYLLRIKVGKEVVGEKFIKL